MAWTLLALGVLAGAGAFLAARWRWPRTHVALTVLALVLVAAASGVLT